MCQIWAAAAAPKHAHASHQSCPLLQTPPHPSHPALTPPSSPSPGRHPAPAALREPVRAAPAPAPAARESRSTPVGPGGRGAAAPHQSGRGAKWPPPRTLLAGGGWRGEAGVSRAAASQAATQTGSRAAACQQACSLVSKSRQRTARHNWFLTPQPLHAVQLSQQLVHHSIGHTRVVVAALGGSERRGEA